MISTPDAVLLTHGDGVLETRVLHRARGADGLGSLGRFVRGWIEDVCGKSLTCRVALPRFVHGGNHTPGVV